MLMFFPVLQKPNRTRRILGFRALVRYGDGQGLVEYGLGSGWSILFNEGNDHSGSGREGRN
jgi:ribosomal protein S5